MLSPLPKNPYQQGANVLLDVKVTTKASQSTVIGWNNGYLLVRLKAVPEKGKANAALTELLGDYFSFSSYRTDMR